VRDLLPHPDHRHGTVTSKSRAARRSRARSQTRPASIPEGRQGVAAETQKQKQQRHRWAGCWSASSTSPSPPTVAGNHRTGAAAALSANTARNTNNKCRSRGVRGCELLATAEVVLQTQLSWRVGRTSTCRDVTTHACELKRVRRAVEKTSGAMACPLTDSHNTQLQRAPENGFQHTGHPAPTA